MSDASGDRLAPVDQPAPQPLVESADYLRWSQTPAAGLLFLLPWLGLYELAILTGSDPLELRNPAESWLQVALRQAGGHYPWLLPVVVAGSLLIWHGVACYRQGPAVRVDSRGTLLAGMLSESAFLAARPALRPCQAGCWTALTITMIASYRTCVPTATPNPRNQNSIAKHTPAAVRKAKPR